MGLLSKLFGGKQKSETPESRHPERRPSTKRVDARGDEPEDAVLLGSQGRISVVGESHYQDALDSVCGGKCEEGHGRKVYAELRLEPDNEFDPNAVGVLVDGQKVGHLSRQDAITYAPVLKVVTEAGKRPLARGFIRGGWKRPDGDEGSYGIELELSDVDVLLKSRKVAALLKA